MSDQMSICIESVLGILAQITVCGNNDGVLTYLARRLLLTIPVLLGVATLVFALIHFIPGDPARAILGEVASEADIAQLRQQLGLDRPLAVQYVAFLGGLARADLGTSLRTGTPVAGQILERFPATFELALAAIVVALTLALPLGIAAAVWRGTVIDHTAMIVSLAGISMPNFWLGPLLAIVFGVELGWLPVAGRGGLEHLVLPAVSLGAALAAVLARMTRASSGRSAARAIRPGRARTWRLARAGRAPPRLAKQPHSDRDAGRSSDRGRAHWSGHHGNDLRLARDRAAARPVDRLPRLPDGAGLHPADRGHVRERQSHRRPRSTACWIRESDTDEKRGSSHRRRGHACGGRRGRGWCPSIHPHRSSRFDSKVRAGCTGSDSTNWDETSFRE